MMNSRRSFIWRLGAGASAAVASTLSMAKAEPKFDSAGHRVGLLEADKALRQLHLAFGRAMDRGLHDAVIGMFTNDAQVVFNGGVFRNRQGVSRLFREHFPSGKTGASLPQAPGFELTAEQQIDRVDVHADLQTASAVHPYSIQVGAPFETESSLAAMARLHGEGVRT